jgi:hypothetical protein
MSAQGVGSIEGGMPVIGRSTGPSPHTRLFLCIHSAVTTQPSLLLLPLLPPLLLLPLLPPLLLRRIAAAIQEAGLQGRVHPLDYLQFFCLAKRESNEQYFGGVRASKHAAALLTRPVCSTPFSEANPLPCLMAVTACL